MKAARSRLLDGRLKMRHLVVIDVLSEHGSMVAAAAQLRVTQPALTRTLREVEDILGVSLYERHPRGLTPTIYGQAFTAHARAVLAQLTQADRHVAELANAERGQVTVGVHLAGSNLLLPRAIARLKAANPRIMVSIRDASPEALLADLEAGQVDFLVGRIVRHPARSGVAQRVLYSEPIRLAVRVGHPAAELDRPSVADLVDYPWIFPGPETALRGELEQVFLQNDLPLPGNLIECTSVLTLRNLLTETDMIAALPLLIARDDLGLALLPIPLAPMSYLVGVTHQALVPPSPAARTLLVHLRSVAGELQTAVDAADESLAGLPEPGSGPALIRPAPADVRVTATGTRPPAPSTP
jgi:DNA-binding transcriptional LysR family regulator